MDTSALAGQQSPMEILQATLHAVSQVALYPVIIILLLMICYAVFSLGSLVVEAVRERRYYKVKVPAFLHAIQDEPTPEVPAAIRASGLLQGQKDVLLTIFNNRDLDEESLWALAKKLLLQEQARCQKVVSRNDAMSKLAPMVGLMGTLIPLGPGIVAFSRGDGSVMAQAMLVAFDTTVAGLITAAVMFAIARVRRRWYVEYHATLEASSTSLLERIGNMPAVERVVERDAEPAGDAFSTPDQDQASFATAVADAPDADNPPSQDVQAALGAPQGEVFSAGPFKGGAQHE